MLAGVVDYSDSENENEEEEEEDDKQDLPHSKRKRKASKEEKQLPKKKALPLPSSISKMFGEVEKGKNCSDHHQGRRRNFDHVEGNWASYVFIPLVENEVIVSLHKEIGHFLRNVNMKEKIHILPLKESHLSLSRTVAVRHYWMDDIFSMLKDGFGSSKKFLYTICGLEVYTNDNATRTFVSLKVNTSEQLSRFVAIVDKVFNDYNLETYYKEASFHISVAWCLGDKKDQLEQFIKNDELNRGLLLNFTYKSTLAVTEKVCVKFGHKIQTIHLQD